MPPVCFFPRRSLGFSKGIGRASVLGWVLLFSGCWDFEALGGGGEPRDLTSIPDLTSFDLVCNQGAATEDCTNGVDDNGDCLADCEDPSCSKTGLCQPITLLGYGRVAATCGMGTTANGSPIYEGFDLGKQVCTKCTCGNPTACKTNLRIHKALDCTDAAGSVTAIPNAMGCPLVTVPGGSMSYFLEPIGVSCPAGAATIAADPIYSRKANFCLPTNAKKDCATLHCVLQQDQVRSGLCIALPAGPCPDPFSVASSYYKTYTDKRTCSCSCNSPGGKVCEGDLTISKKTDCKGSPMERKDITADAGGCKPLSNISFTPYYLDNNLKPIGGTKCTVDSKVMGENPSAGEPMTVCCIP